MSLRWLCSFLLLATLANGPAIAADSEEDDNDELFFDFLYMPLFLIFGSITTQDVANALIPSFEFFNTITLEQEINSELFQNF